MEAQHPGSPAPTNAQGWLAISPMILFLTLYLAVSIALGDFYKMPFAVALLAAAAWAMVIFRGRPLAQRIEVFSRRAGAPGIIYMIWIFVLAGAFAAVARAVGAVDATVALTLQVVPPEFVAPGLFVAACFISLAVGTSVGTVVALTPLAVELAAPGHTPFFVAAVLGGAFFGDNLSFISDTTIAATRTQGCDMADKFKANIWIALPAALATLVLYCLIDAEPAAQVEVAASDGWLVVPYLVVIATALAGLNVTIVLMLGLLSALAMGIGSGANIMDLVGAMGAGIDGMGNLIVITLLSAGLIGVVEAMGGVNWILSRVPSRISGRRGGQACIGVLVGIVNLCTANNTVAILAVGDVARGMARRFGIAPRKSASLLDTCSCIVQCLIPYGAQTLLAASLADISPAAPFPYMYYPWALAVAVGVAILWTPKKRARSIR